MSGTLEQSSLEENFSENDSVYLVTITGSVTGQISEIYKKDRDASKIVVYRAVVDQIIYKSNISITSSSDKWHIKLPSPEKGIISQIHKKKESYPGVNDEILISDFENIHYSYVYYIEGLHKIFIYHNCPDSVKSVLIGQKYFFICMNNSLKTNPVLYGNIDLGLFPYTKDIRWRIDKIISSE
jgi:hypothetical protein